MRPISISVDDVASFAANRYLAWQHSDLPPERIAFAKRITEFNVKVCAFNAATVLLVSAVFLAVMLKLIPAFVIGSIGYFIRQTVDHNLDLFDDPPGMADMAAVGQRVLDAVRGRRPEDAAQNILDRLGIAGHEDWISDQVKFEHHVLWKNLAPVGIGVRPELAGRERAGGILGGIARAVAGNHEE